MFSLIFRDRGREGWPGGSVGWIIIYTKKLGVRSLVGAHTGGNQSMFLSHIHVFFSLSFPSSPSKISKHILG